MGFLKRFLKTTYRDGQPSACASSFQHLTQDELETHLRIDRYNGFTLTKAIRPSYDLQVVPQAGYRHDVFSDPNSGIQIPVLMASVSREQILDVFIDLLEPLGEEVDLILETSHGSEDGEHQDLCRDHIDLPILRSMVYEFEEQILDDGCLGVAVLNQQLPLEVQLDEHKLFMVYGQDLTPFEQVFDRHGIPLDPEIHFLSEAEHVHASSEEFVEQLEELKYRFGIED